MAKIDGDTRVTGIIGKSLSHSLSPFLHNNVYKKLEKPYIYVPFPVEGAENLKDVLKGLMNAGALGFNVTVPYKEDVVKIIDRLSEDAQIIGAVNVIHFKNGAIKGYNTDGAGFILNLKNDLKFELKDKNILILGAGGSARAVIYSLAKENASGLTIANRTISKAEDISRKFSPFFKKTNFLISGLNFPKLNLKEYDLIINCTSSSLNNYNLNFPFHLLKKKTIVSDLIYPLKKSPFLIEAKKKGHRVVDGLLMLAYQAALSFEIWFDTAPPFDLYKKYALKSKKCQ